MTPFTGTHPWKHVCPCLPPLNNLLHSSSVVTLNSLCEYFVAITLYFPSPSNGIYPTTCFYLYIIDLCLQVVLNWHTLEKMRTDQQVCGREDIVGILHWTNCDVAIPLELALREEDKTISANCFQKYCILAKKGPQ